MLKWPTPRAVDEAVRALAIRLAAAHPELERFGYFGSYARGDWGVGSDVNLLAIVSHSNRPFVQRPLDFAVDGLPVPADLLVYTRKEWEASLRSDSPFARRLDAETVWVWGEGATTHARTA